MLFLFEWSIYYLALSGFVVYQSLSHLHAVKKKGGGGRKKETHQSLCSLRGLPEWAVTVASSKGKPEVLCQGSDNSSGSGYRPLCTLRQMCMQIIIPWWSYFVHAHLMTVVLKEEKRNWAGKNTNCWAPDRSSIKDKQDGINWLTEHLAWTPHDINHIL